MDPGGYVCDEIVIKRRREPSFLVGFSDEAPKQYSRTGMKTIGPHPVLCVLSGKAYLLETVEMKSNNWKVTTII